MASDEQHLMALRTYWKANKAFPPMAKLCEVVGLSSTASVFQLVSRLTEAGYLARVDGRIAPTKKFFARPLLGKVRAGGPQLESQEGIEFVTLDDYLIDDPNRTVLCRVSGDSMVDAGLLDGDIVVVQQYCPTAPGDIVVAVVDGEITVKFLRLTRGRFWLEPANPEYSPIHPAGSLEIFGVVV